MGEWCDALSNGRWHAIKDVRGFLEHASLSSNDGLEINVEGSERLYCGSASFAPGTGFGESFLTWDGSQYFAHVSEGGHSDFAPTDECQIRLLHHLLPRFGHGGVEHVCSGIGVPNI
jgi:glucokinase